MLEVSDLKVEVKEVRDDFDYIYDFKSLKELRGNMYHKKKNHVNQFKKQYDWSKRPISPINFSDVLEVMSIWFTDDTQDMVDEKGPFKGFLTTGKISMLQVHFFMSMKSLLPLPWVKFFIKILFNAF